MYKNFDRNRDRMYDDFQQQKKHFDANRDQQVKNQMSVFYNNDVDGDGKIQAKEIRAKIEKQIEEQKERERKY